MKTTEEKLEEWDEVKDTQEEANYVEWEKEQTTVIGKLVKLFESKDGSWFAKVDTGSEDKKLTMFSAPTILRGRLDGHLNETVKIVYLGKVKFQSGKTGKDFKVYVKKNAPPATPGSGVPPDQTKSHQVEAFL